MLLSVNGESGCNKKSGLLCDLLMYEKYSQSQTYHVFSKITTKIKLYRYIYRENEDEVTKQQIPLSVIEI